MPDATVSVSDVLDTSSAPRCRSYAEVTELRSRDPGAIGRALDR